MQELQSDEEIIALYKDSNEEVFKELVKKYTPAIFNFSARLSGKENAKDITQEIFIKIWKNINKFKQEKSSLKTWIFTVARNTVTDFLRKKKSLTFSDFENEDYSPFEDMPDENLLPDEVLQKMEDIKLFKTILEQLPTNYKTVLSLHYEEEMTFEEIGQVLGKPLNTVKSYHRRAILELRKKLL